VSHNEAAQYRLAVLDDSKQRYLYGNHLGVGRISTPVTLCAAGTLPTTHSATGMTPRLPSAGGHTSHTPGVYPPLPPPLDPQIKRIVTMVEPTPERAAAGPKPPPRARSAHCCVITHRPRNTSRHGGVLGPHGHRTDTTHAIAPGAIKHTPGVRVSKAGRYPIRPLLTPKPLPRPRHSEAEAAEGLAPPSSPTLEGEEA
jgi:hypothetical protein